MFVQLVMAAITTSPCLSVSSCPFIVSVPGLRKLFIC